MEGKSKARKTPICSTCGCSFVRLGITKKQSSTRNYQGRDHSFCCEGCAKIFDKDPESLLKETSPLEVCPSCLAEKPIHQTISLGHEGEPLYFCKCPHCVAVFQQQPEYFLKRLAGEIEYSGVFSDGQGCCPQ